jgi:2'-5' RNA ligase
MRTFIAIDLDERLKTVLDNLAAQLRPLTKSVRWTGNAGMHLTLKFLGEVPDDAVPRISSRLEEVAVRHRPFLLTLQGTGTFPPGGRPPRILWVGIAPEPQLFALQDDVEREMEKLGFGREDRPFHPHLTIGRVKFPSRLDALVEEMNKRRAERFGEMNVQRLTFFQSVLMPSGAQYAVLKECPLG